MRLRTTRFALPLLLCTACAQTAPTRSVQDAAAPAAVVQDEGGGAITPEMQMKMMQLAQPGPEHELLEGLAGEWSISMKMWMAPEQPPVRATATGASEMVLGGRFLKSTTEGEMKVMGMTIPIETLGMLGFDRRNEVYTSVGFDTMGTYFVTAEGAYDAASNTLTLSGEDHDETFDLTQTYRFVYRFEDDDTFHVDIVFTNPEMTHGRDEFKMVEMTYERVAADAAADDASEERPEDAAPESGGK